MCETWLSTVRHVALEGRCFVLSCCQFARRGDYPADYVTDFGGDPETVVMRGGSCIVGPPGNVLAGPASAGETIRTADCDLDDIVRGKYDFDVAAHYARPDVFELQVNERATGPVTNRTDAVIERPALPRP